MCVEHPFLLHECEAGCPQSLLQVSLCDFSKNLLKMYCCRGIGQIYVTFVLSNTENKYNGPIAYMLPHMKIVPTFHSPMILGLFDNLHLNTELFSIKERICFWGHLGNWVCYERFNVGLLAVMWVTDLKSKTTEQNQGHF